MKGVTGVSVNVDFRGTAESKYLCHSLIPLVIFSFGSQLIKAGADLNGKDVDGWTPLHAAAHWGQEEACRVLLESSCDMSSKNNCVSFSIQTLYVTLNFQLHLNFEWREEGYENMNYESIKIPLEITCSE